MFRVAAVAVTMLGLAGCSGPTLQLDSYPTGAVVTEPATGVRWVTPALLQYNQPVYDAQGCVVGSPLVVTWASGTQKPYTPHLCGGGTTFHNLVVRPVGPGNESDIEVGRQRILQINTGNAQVQAQAVQPQPVNPQAQAAWGDAAYQLGCAIADGCGSPSYGGDVDVNVNTDCTSHVIGNTVHTRCR